MQRQVLRWSDRHVLCTTVTAARLSDPSGTNGNDVCCLCKYALCLLLRRAVSELWVPLGPSGSLGHAARRAKLGAAISTGSPIGREDSQRVCALRDHVGYARGIFGDVRL